MKTQLLKFTAFLLIFAGVATSCNPEIPKEVVYPIDISFTEYSLLDTDCQWINLPYDEKVIVINSSEELEKYISCTGGAYPDIDFSKQSLLLVNGKTNGDIYETKITDLQELSFNKYKLNIEINFYENTNIDTWNSALILEVLNEESSVDLELNLKKIEIEYPIEIPIEDFSLAETSCGWAIQYNHNHELVIINCYEELEKIISCTDGNFPDIDFSEHTVLCAIGALPNGIEEISKQLLQISNDEFSLNINITMSGTTYSEKWWVVIKSPKLLENKKVKLNVNYY